MEAQKEMEKKKNREEEEEEDYLELSSYFYGSDEKWKWIIFADLMKNENERGRMRKTPNLNGSFNRNKNG